MGDEISAGVMYTPWPTASVNLTAEFQAGLRQMNQPVNGALAIAMPDAGPSLPARAMELISPTYFRASFKSLFDMLLTGQSDMPYATELTIGNENIKLADGSLSYEKNFQSRSQELVNQSARQYVNAASVYSLNQFTRLDPQFEQWLEAFIVRMQADGVTVIFYLPPYHPYVYDRLIASEQYRIIESAQTYFTRLANEKQVLLLGSYNPQDVGCEETEFYDGMHAKYTCIVKVFQPLR